jgi:excinuclease ABC subunit B
MRLNTLLYYDYYQPEAYVPASDTYIEKDASINEHIEQMRLSATRALLERTDTIIVATVSSIYGLGDPRAYLSMVLHLVRGEAADQRVILRRLAELQYTRNEVELHRATYRVREIIDIFPAESTARHTRGTLRRSDRFRLVRSTDRALLRQVPRLTICPKTHYATPREVLNAIDQIKVDLKQRLEELRQANSWWRPSAWSNAPCSTWR